jgi:hypothetical protein
LEGNKHKVKMISKFISLFFISLIFIFSCSEDSTGPEIDIFALGDTTGEDDKIYITDLTGKRWDVTHAVNHYGFNRTQFRHGLGPFSIKPILDPEIIGPNDPSYPSSNEGFLVIGTTIAGESRAYPLLVLSRHEIVDEIFDSTHVAVAF